MSNSEPEAWTQERQQRLSAMFPTLNLASPDDIFAVDNHASRNGGAPTPLSQVVMSMARYTVEPTAPEPTPDAPDTAPNAVPWQPSSPSSPGGGGGSPDFNDIVGRMNAAGETPQDVNAPTPQEVATAGAKPFPWGQLAQPFIDPLGAAGVPSNTELLGKAGIDTGGLPDFVNSGLNAIRPGIFGVGPKTLLSLGGMAAGGVLAEQGRTAAVDALPETGVGGAARTALANPLVAGGIDLAAQGAAFALTHHAITRAPTYMSAFERALTDTKAAEAAAAPEASQYGRAPGQDSISQRANVTSINVGSRQIPTSPIEGSGNVQAVDDFLRARGHFNPSMAEGDRARLAGDIYDAERSGGGTPAFAGGANEPLSRAEQMQQAREQYAAQQPPQSRLADRDQQIINLRRMIDSADQKLATLDPNSNLYADETLSKMMSERELHRLEAGGPSLFDTRPAGPTASGGSALEPPPAWEVPYSATGLNAGKSRPPNIGEAVAVYAQHPAAGPDTYIRWDEPGLKPGAPLSPSRVWQDGDPTPNLMEGTATIDPRAAARLGRNDLTTFYEGTPYLVTGERIASGADPAEVVLRDARVVAPLTPERSGAPALSGGSAEGTTPLMGEPSAAGGSRPPEPPTPNVPGVPPEDAFTALRDALASEVELRRSGVPASEIAAGRARQAAGIAGNLQGAEAANATLAERLAAAKSGARAGGLRQTFNQPLELTADTVNGLAAHLQGVLERDGAFTQFNGLSALDALVKGENVQPAQLKLLQRVFGNDIGDLAAQANKKRISPIATVDATGRAVIERAGVFQEKSIATAEQTALAQFKHADELKAQLAMDPTNQRLAATEAAARERGVKAQNTADTLLERRTTALTPSPVDTLESLAQQKATSGAVDTLRQAELAQRSGRALTEDQQALLDARDLMGRKLAISSTAGKDVLETVDTLLKGNRAILDVIKNDHPALIGLQAGITGDIPDSFLSAALIRRGLMREVISGQGVQPEIANQMASVLFKRELALHYGGEVPQGAKDMLAKAFQAGASGTDDPGFFTTLVQRSKNTMFGADFGVLGVQALNAVRRGNIPLLVGTINRGLASLSLPRIASEITGSSLDRITQYAIDGVSHGTASSAVRPSAGTMLAYYGESNLPLAGRVMAMDKGITRALDGLNNVQFKNVLGTIRDLDHEGNLVMLKMLGRDIQNPAVRAQAAENANTLTSFARSALSGARRNAEGVLLTSPSMTRARINTILQMAKLVTPRASVEQRIMAASMIVSTYVTYTAAAKWLNDQIGTKDMETDPSKTGYGMIQSKFIDPKTGRNMLIDVVPQDSVERAFAVSIRALADPAVDDAAAQRAWERVMLGSSSIVPRIGLAAGFRTGYEPGKGYSYGNLSRNGVLESFLPVPPAVTNAATGAGPLEQGLGAVGVSAYPENASKSGSTGVRPVSAYPKLNSTATGTYPKIGVK